MLEAGLFTLLGAGLVVLGFKLCADMFTEVKVQEQEQAPIKLDIEPFRRKKEEVEEDDSNKFYS